MPILLLYIFAKGPAWLRLLTWTCFAGIFLFACLSTLNTFRIATERPVPAHVHHYRKH